MSEGLTSCRRLFTHAQADAANERESPVVSGYLIDRFQNWELLFVCDAVLMILGLVLSFRMRPDDTFEPANVGKTGDNRAASLSAQP
jgi:hypothetical protein